MGASELRDLYLKTENYLGGEYFARMVKVSEPWASQALLGFPTASASREWGPAGAPVLFPFLNPCPSSSGEGQAPTAQCCGPGRQLLGGQEVLCMDCADCGQEEGEDVHPSAALHSQACCSACLQPAQGTGSLCLVTLLPLGL